MLSSNLIRWSGLANILSGVSLALFWFSFPLLLPLQDLRSNYVNLVLDSDWVTVNALDIIGITLGLLGLIGLYAKQVEKAGILGFVGFLLTFIGLALLEGIAFYETFIWPVLAVQAPTLLSFQGPLYTNTTFLLGSGLGLMTNGVGIILFGAAMLRAGILPRWGVLLLTVGAPLYGFGALFGELAIVLRSIGVALYAVGLAWLGYTLWASKSNMTGQPKSVM
ncbi:MAG TPA: hypothetical protein VI793_13400 [Anaerolineales bacterium]|nr:hypothetical protein [Anaerolineales bacterium]